MFTGIIKALGIVTANKNSLRVRARLSRIKPGDSIAVNGACLTVKRRNARAFEFDLSPQTLRLTNLGRLKPGDSVNLEPPLRASDFVSGHWVLGHVDARARVLKRQALNGGFMRLRIALPRRLRCWVAPQGSIAVDGISLTVTRLKHNYFETVLIPETLKKTTLGRRIPGDFVNLEADLLARYVKAKT